MAREFFWWNGGAGEAEVVEEADRGSQSFCSLSGFPMNPLQVKSFPSFLSLLGAQGWQPLGVRGALTAVSL